MDCPVGILSIRNVKVLIPPNPIEVGAKLLLNPGRFVSTVKSAVAGETMPTLEVRELVTLLCVPM